MGSTSKNIGKRIAYRRCALGFETQKALADRLSEIGKKDYKQETVARWETNTRNIKADDLIVLAEALDCTVDFLLCADDHPHYEGANACDVTGLSPEAVKILSDMHNREDNPGAFGCLRFIDYLIRSVSFRHIGYFFSEFHDSYPELEFDRAELARYRIYRLFESFMDQATDQMKKPAKDDFYWSYIYKEFGTTINPKKLEDRIPRKENTDDSEGTDKDTVS